MIYVLIALALFGALTITLSSQNEQADGEEISDEQAELYAVELIEYAASAKNVADQMIMTGTSIDELDFVPPTSAVFDTAPHIHKIYHPAGGGLNYRFKYNNAMDITATSGWYRVSTNIEWTPTAAHDVTLTAIRIPESVCTAINKKITGNTTIPALDDFLSTYFTIGTADLNDVNCPDCVGYPSLCVIEDTGTFYAFYNIIAAR